MRPLITLTACALTLVLSSCGTPTVDTGIHGIQVPADVTNVENTVWEDFDSDIYEAELPDWEYDDAVTWMEKNLPIGEVVDGMDYFRKLDGEHGVEWSWRGESRSGKCHSLFVDVEEGDMGGPVSLSVLNIDDDDITCLL